MYDWDDIRIFLAVAEEGSTLAASRVLNMNQTTVSRRIQALEHALGLTLFERDTRGYCLTGQGTALTETATQMRNSARKLSLRGDQLGRASVGTIRVTAAHAAMNHWVLPLISGFRQQTPDVEFETNTIESYVSLEHGEADIAFRACDKIVGDTLIVKKMPSVSWGVYCSETYQRTMPALKSAEDMKQHKFLSYPRQMIEDVALLKWLDQHCDPDNNVSTVDAVITMSASLRNEMAVGVLPCVEGDFVPDLVTCFTVDHLKTGFWLVASKEAYQEPRVRKFMKYATAHFPRYKQTTVA